MIRFLSILFFIVIVIVPISVMADGLVPCGGSGEPECTLCHLQNTAGKFVDGVIVVATLLATILFVNAGILYVFSPANPGNIQKAHSIFLTTLVGFIIILSAWLIINLIMTTLYDGEDSWKNVLCDGSTTSTTGSDTDDAGGDEITVNDGDDSGDASDSDTGDDEESPPTSGTLSDTDARSALDDYYGFWESSPGATTFENLQQTTVEGATALAKDFQNKTGSSDKLTITGGTEAGYHTDGDGMTHGNGYKLDIDDNDTAFNNYVVDNFEYSGERAGSNGGSIYTGTIDGHSIEAVKEGTHWDVTFKGEG